VNGVAVPVKKLGLARLRVPVLGGKRRDLVDDVSARAHEEREKIGNSRVFGFMDARADHPQQFTAPARASAIKEYIDKGLGFITCTFYNFDIHARDIDADLDDMNFFYDDVIPQLK
jgi:hypothetical protein